MDIFKGIDQTKNVYKNLQVFFFFDQHRFTDLKGFNNRIHKAGITSLYISLGTLNPSTEFNPNIMCDLKDFLPKVDSTINSIEIIVSNDGTGVSNLRCIESLLDGIAYYQENPNMSK